MRKLVFSIALLMLSVCSFSQVKSGGKTIKPAQSSASIQTQKQYYFHALVWIRWADTIDGARFVVLMSPGRGEKQAPHMLKDSSGKYLYFYTKSDAMNYVESLGWEFTDVNDKYGFYVRKPTTKAELDQAVKENTHSTDAKPNVQLDAAERTMKLSYD